WLRTRATRFLMALGTPRRSRSASAVSLQAQLMLDLAPGFGFPLLDLLESVSHLLGLRRRQHVVGINHSFWFDEHAVLLLAEGHKIPFAKFEGLEHIPWDNHLAPLAYATASLSG